MDLSDTTQLAATVFAAVAAAASWASVIQARRFQREMIEPELHAQPLRVGARGRSETELHFTVLNAGPGLAKGVGYLFVAGDKYVLGFGATGFLRAGEEFRVRTDIPGGPETLGVVFCHGARGRTLIWNLAGEFKELPIDGSRMSHSLDELLAAHHPEVDLKALTQVEKQVTYGGLLQPGIG